MNATVIIPAYNPEENLKQIVDQVWELGNQVIVVDDGSAQDKAELFHKLSEDAIVIHHETNRGKGAAIKTALNYIKENLWDCNTIGVMDADGQHLPADMERLLLRASEQDFVLVLGVRKIGKEMPLKSRLGNRITRTVFYALSGLKVTDTQTGLRAFSRKLLEDFLTVEGERYEYETNALFYCAKSQIPIAEVPIRTIYHDDSNSCSHFHPVKDSFRIYRDILKFAMSSLSSFVLDYVLFCLLLTLVPAGTETVVFANIFARICSGFYNYLMNCRFVFHRGAQTRTGLQYLGLATGILVLNSLILQGYTGLLSIPAAPAKILTECTLFLISFLVQKNWIFKGKKMHREMVRA